MNEPSVSWAKRLTGAAMVGMIWASTTAFAAATPDQLLVTGANASGDSVYDLNLSPSSSTPIKPVIANTTTLVNSAADAKTHGTFDALVWASNAYCKALDLIVADASKGQIVRYSGASTLPNCYNPAHGTPPVNPTAQVIFKWTKVGSGPAQPNGLSVDANGNLFVISSASLLDPKASVWVLPFNQTANQYCSNQPAGAYCAPVLIDNKFSGQFTLLLADSLVASTTTPQWKAGDLLVLVGDSFAARLAVYSQTVLYGSNGNLKTSLTLSGPSSIAIPFQKFLQVLAAPFGMDLWPADPAHSVGTSMLFPTIDGRIVRYDTAKSAFVANFASGLGLGLQKLRVGTYANVPYAFVAQLRVGNSGQILAFAAPPASGANKPFATVTSGVSNPVGLAVSNAGSVPAPQNCTDCVVDPLGPVAVTTFTAPPGVNFPGTVTEVNCIVPSDPRVTFEDNWTCSGAALPIGAGTPYCPTFPASVIPGSVCGHSGPSGAGFAVIEGTATGIDPAANNTFFETQLNIDAVLPGPTNLECSPFTSGNPIPLTAWGTRSDLTTVEGTIAEDTLGFPALGGAPGYLSELTTSCDYSTSGGHGISIFAYGLALSDPSTDFVYDFQQQKYQAIEQTISDAAISTNVQSTLATTVTAAETHVENAQEAANPTPEIDCALAQIYATDQFLRNNLTAFASNLVTTGAGGGNPDPAGDIDGRLANWYLTLNTEILGNQPPMAPSGGGYPLPFPVPASSVPPSCFTVGGTVSGLPAGSGPSGLVLQDNGGDNLALANGANGNFTFPTALPAGSPYNVTVQNSPSGESCSVTNGSGTVTNANITSVVVTCSAVVAGGPPGISNVSYLYTLNNEQIDNIEFTSMNLFSCNVGDLLYAYQNNDNQYDLSGVPGNGTFNNGFFVTLPADNTALFGTDTITLTCYDSTGTIPVFGGPVLIVNPDLPTPTNQLTITNFSADTINNALIWATSNANSSTNSTVCSLLDEFGNQPETPDPVPQAPILNLPSNTGGFVNGEYLYPNNVGPSCPETMYADTVTLTCADPKNGAAVQAITVNWSSCEHAP